MVISQYLSWDYHGSCCSWGIILQPVRHVLSSADLEDGRGANPCQWSKVQATCVDRFQISRGYHRCRLVGIEAQFNGICDVLGARFRVIYRNTIRYIYLGVLSSALLN
jgi:hypothetical protein